MRRLMLATTGAIGVLATGAMAAPLTSCSGTLKQIEGDNWGLYFPPEGVCLFTNKAITAKVLKTCTPGQLCTVTGIISNDCDEECVEVKRLRSVRSGGRK